MARSKRTQRRVAYAEPSTSSSDSSHFSGSDDYNDRPRRSTRPSTPETSSVSSALSKKRKAKETSLSKRPTAKKPKVRPRSPLQASTPPRQSRARSHIPPWPTLPYGILFQVFQYASNPLLDEYLRPTPAVAWLSRTALVCKSFLEPALAALYYAPPLSPPTRARALIARLASQSSTSAINYKSKVKYIEVEALTTLVLKYNGMEPVDLADLVKQTPQLRGVRIHLLTDEPKFQCLELACKKLGTVYKESLFDTLERSGISLLQWKWNCDLNRSKGKTSQNAFSPWPVLHHLHARPMFQRLQSLEVVGYKPSKSFSQANLSTAVRTLPSLRRLKLTLCRFEDGQSLLSSLPEQLDALTLSCCSGDLDTFPSFLATHGTHLKELNLDHLQQLNLDFLSGFATACPKLEVFKMNMTYYSSFMMSRNSNPRFASLLRPGEVPTWPNTLRHIELLHMKQWTSGIAETFFESLLDSAPTLPDLRRLILKASIAINWRDRVTFRDRWIGELRKVFLRHCADPNPRWSSLRSSEASMRSDGGCLVLTGKEVQDNDIPSSGKEVQVSQQPDSRRAGLRRKNGSISYVIDRDVPTVPTRRSARHPDKAYALNPTATNEDAHASEDSESDSDRPLLLARQSLHSGRADKRRSSDASRIVDTESDSDVPIILKLRRKHAGSSLDRSPPSNRRSVRLRRNAGTSPREDHRSTADQSGDDDSEDPSGGRAGASWDKEPAFIQGLCDVVSIGIDNLRPSEIQLDESNFLDAELSGDEDWNGEENEDNNGYAW